MKAEGGYNVSGHSISKILGLLEKLYLSYRANGERMPSVLLLGKPGVGKTEGVLQLGQRLAKRLGKEFVDFSKITKEKFVEVVKEPERFFVVIGFAATHAEPTDFSGYPVRDSEHVSLAPLEYAYILSLPKITGILFVDEITLDSRIDRRSAELKLLSEGQLGFRALSQGVIIVTAGNTDADTSLAQPLPDPVLRGRVMRFYVSPPSVEEWISYMDSVYNGCWEKKIAAFLMKYKEFLWRRYEGDEGYDPRLSPRNWTKLARILWSISSEITDEEELGMLVGSLISQQEATLLLTFLKTHIPDLEEIAPETWKKLTVDAKYIVTTMLSQREPEELVERFRELLEVMAETDREFLELLKLLMPLEKRRKLLLFTMRMVPRVYKAFKENFSKSEEMLGDE